MESQQLARPTAWLRARHLAAATLVTVVLVGSQLLIAHRYDLAQEERLAGRRTATPTAQAEPRTATDADASVARSTVAAVRADRPAGH